MMIQQRQEENAAEFNLLSPQRSQQTKLVSPRFSFSSPVPKKERAHPPLAPRSAPGARSTSFKSAMKTLVSPVKKASDMLSGSFHNTITQHSLSRVCKEQQNEDEEEKDYDDDDDEKEESKNENSDLTLMLLCKELELLSD
jgi:hypothetical protein